LWKGNLSATYLWIFYGVVQFATYGFLKDALSTVPDPFMGRRPSTPIDAPGTSRICASDHHTSSNRLWKTMTLFLAGAGAGIAATAATYPFDLMRTQFTIQGNTQVYTSMHSFVSQTFKNKGIKGR
jgi:solute carrier family 25 thiamine pyrophosphate transporter 19